MDDRYPVMEVHCSFCAELMGTVHKKQNKYQAYQLKKLVRSHACYRDVITIDSSA